MNRIEFDDRVYEIFGTQNEVRLRTFYEPEEGLFIAETPMVIERALDAGYRPELLLVEEKIAGAGAADVLARCEGVPVCLVSDEELKQIAGYHLARGALCAMRRRPLPDAAEVCAGVRRVAVLEHVTNPTNVGAIFRSAAAMGVGAVLLTEGCTDPLYRRALRVSVGTILQIPWTFISGYDVLKQLGFRTAAMALNDDSVSVADPRLKTEEKLAILLGSEGYGLDQDTVDACDYVVKIPMNPVIDSLNVAAAAAVVFWELSKPAGPAPEGE